MSGLTVQGLRVAYRRRGRRLPVLHGIDLRIAPGETYGLVGESGCGKTTAALALLRALPAGGRVEGGTALLDGHDLLRLDPATLRRWRGSRLAMVAQEPGRALNPTLRVGLQVAEVYRTHRRLGRRQAIAAAAGMLATVGLPDPGDLLRRYPHQLSGGQQQRVAIAIALAGDPRLLVLDEPTTALDATHQAEILDLLARQGAARLDASILFITHNLAVVAQVCDRVGVLYGGRIVEEGPTGQVLQRPAHPYTAGLLGCVPDPTAGAVARLVPIPGSLPTPERPPAGCAFAPRCPIADQPCHTADPPAADLQPGGGWWARCLRPGEAGPPGRHDPAGPALRVLPWVAGQKTRPLLQVRDVNKRHGRVQAVDQVSIEVRAGETLGLVGESGCGKTSLARLVAGLDQPDGGQVLLDGAPLAGRVERRDLASARAIQMVFQDPDATLNPSHRVGAILHRAITRSGGAGTPQELAARVLLEPHHLERRAAELSGGLKQRVAIARAFAGRPRLVLCDEPVSALDVSVQAAVLNLLADLQAAEQVAYLLVSHDLGVVRYLAHRIAVMYLGQLVETGPADRVLKPPHHPYTEVLLAAVPRLPPPGAPRGRAGPAPALAPPPAPGPSPRPDRLGPGAGPGCRFAARCPRRLGPVCDTEPPPARLAGPGHVIRCHHPVERLAESQRSQSPQEDP